MHAAQQVEAHSEEAPLRAEDAEVHARGAERFDVRRRQVAGAEAVDEQVHFDAAPAGIDEYVAQFVSDLVLEQDERLDQHLSLRGADRIEHGRKEFLAVDQ